MRKILITLSLTAFSIVLISIYIITNHEQYPIDCKVTNSTHLWSLKFRKDKCPSFSLLFSSLPVAKLSWSSPISKWVCNWKWFHCGPNHFIWMFPRIHTDWQLSSHVSSWRQSELEPSTSKVWRYALKQKFSSRWCHFLAVLLGTFLFAYSLKHDSIVLPLVKGFLITEKW